MSQRETETIIKRWVILADPGCAPEKKGSFNDDEHLEQFLREVIACRPAQTAITVAYLTWNHDLWLESGRGWIAERDEWRKERTAA